MLNVAVLVSGGGTNLQALIDAKALGKLKDCLLTLVISSRDDAFALERAKKAGIQTEVVNRANYNNSCDFDKAIMQYLDMRNIDIVVLAGFMRILGFVPIEAFKNRIINVHPSLIPSFCGVGMYGLRVHKAALESGVKITGATVHLVSDICDCGEILLQKAVAVLPDDTPEILQKRVMTEAEQLLLPEALQIICDRINMKNI